MSVEEKLNNAVNSYSNKHNLGKSVYNNTFREIGSKVKK